MSRDNNNGHNHNHNNRNDKPIDQPPAAKRRKTTRTQIFTEYKEFLSIINKLSKEYDPASLARIKYTKNEGLKCDTCMADSKLKQWLALVAKIWWCCANRQIECNELDIMCDEDDDIQMTK